MYVFPVEGFNRNIADNKILEAYYLKKRRGIERYALTEFIDALNDDHINLDANWVRMIDDNEGYYPISHLHIDDLKQAGFNTKKVSKNDLNTLADKMNDDFCDWMYWDSLNAIGHNMGIQKSRKIKRK